MGGGGGTTVPGQQNANAAAEAGEWDPAGLFTYVSRVVLRNLSGRQRNSSVCCSAP